MSDSQLNDTESSVITTKSIVTDPAPAPDMGLYSQAVTSIATSFIGIIGLILLLGWLVKRFGWKKNADNLIDVKASYIINPKERIILVHVDNQLLVIGVTAQQMTLLHTISEERSQLILSQEKNIKSDVKNSLFRQILQSTLKSRKE
ncbi:flagellar biosynthetic protein FliO [uncultured Gilliamella sp.]|uniref:flagellar biosynthetic protein FliO n=1 Tax=uncultured Gilliamella sp. TaxID=1193505 RepID=UPI0025FF9031|nr:flagellar biosynthetic protein FliO [uncultured Gilliamella sp.]